MRPNNMEKDNHLENRDDIKQFCRSLISEAITNNNYYSWDENKSNQNTVDNDLLYENCSQIVEQVCFQFMDHHRNKSEENINQQSSYRFPYMHYLNQLTQKHKKSTAENGLENPVAGPSSMSTKKLNIAEEIKLIPSFILEASLNKIFRDNHKDAIASVNSRHLTKTLQNLNDLSKESTFRIDNLFATPEDCERNRLSFILDDNMKIKIIGSKSSRSCNDDLNGLFDSAAELVTASESQNRAIVKLPSKEDDNFLGNFKSFNFLSQLSTTQKASNVDKNSKQSNCLQEMSKLLLLHPSDDDKGSSNNIIDVNRFNELDVLSNRHQYYQFPLTHTFLNHFLKRHTRNHDFLSSRQQRREKQSQPIGASNIISRRNKHESSASPGHADDRARREEFQPIITCIIENSLNLVSSRQNLQIINDLMKDETNNSKNHSCNEFPKSGEQLLEECEATNTQPLEEAQCSNKLPHGNNINVCISSMSHKNKDTGHITEDNNSAESNLEIEIDRASREAIVDSDSQENFLDVPSMSLQVSDTESDVPDSLGRSFDFINENAAENEDAALVMNNVNLFPEWLQQIMLVPSDEGAEDNEPHFYCQGDGFGVHPSTVAIDVEEDAISFDSNTSSEEFTLAETDTDEENMAEVQEQGEETNSSVIQQNDDDLVVWSDVDQWDDISE